MEKNRHIYILLIIHEMFMRQPRASQEEARGLAGTLALTPIVCVNDLHLWHAPSFLQDSASVVINYSYLVPTAFSK